MILCGSGRSGRTRTSWRKSPPKSLAIQPGTRYLPRYSFTGSKRRWQSGSFYIWLYHVDAMFQNGRLSLQRLVDCMEQDKSMWLFSGDTMLINYKLYGRIANSEQWMHFGIPALICITLLSRKNVVPWQRIWAVRGMPIQGKGKPPKYDQAPPRACGWGVSLYAIYFSGWVMPRHWNG